MNKPVTRIQTNLLATAERRLLTAICDRLPAWVTPDQLTVLGLIGAAMAGLGYGLSEFGVGWLAMSIVGICLNWFGDSLDGSLARHRQIERPAFGYFVDHSADALASLMILAGVGIGPFVQLEIALLVLAAYLLLAIHTFLSVRVMGEMRLSYLAAGPTELRIAIIGVTVWMMVWGADRTRFPQLSPFDYVFGAAAIIMLGIFIKQTGATARMLRAAAAR